jgi:type IV secretory pathway TraG/TraD family ATPase VirD4
LPQVRRILTSPPDVFKALLGEMLNNRSRGGFVAAAAARIMRGIDFGEINSILSSTDKHIEWLSSPELQKTLSRSDFSMDALKEKPTTLYIVVPTEDLNQHNRLVRVFQTMGLRSAAKAKSKIPILYVMDEFYSMGRSEALARQIANIPGYNIKLWPILQNLGQLIELYPRNWQTFIANTGAFQIIGANDRETLTLTREMLGQHLVQGQTVNLRENNEIGMMTSRESGCSIVVRNGASPLYIARCPYFRLFGKHQYGPDPEHRKS